MYYVEIETLIPEMKRKYKCITICMLMDHVGFLHVDLLC